MKLGAKGVLDLMNSMGGLSSASKFWSPGDKVVYIFPVDGTDENGAPNFPVAYKFGHSVDLGDDYKRSFIPSMSEIDELTNQVKKGDFAFQVSGIFRALLEGEKARKIESIKRDTPDENAQKIELKNLEEDMKKRFPAVGRLTVKAYTEVLVGKLDVNGHLIGGVDKLEYASLQISRKKLGQLIQQSTIPGAYIPGTNYFYIVMQTQNVDKKQAGQVDWNAITDESKKLETLHPDFREKVTAIFQQKSPTEETIAAKVYDFRPYDLNEFKAAVANYVNQRLYMLKDFNGEYHEFVRSARNVEALNALGLIQSAEEINKYLQSDETNSIEENAEVLQGNEAQQIDIASIVGN